MEHNNVLYDEIGNKLKTGDFIEGKILDKSVDNSDYFCSKLIADTYIYMGFLTVKYPPNSYKPKDFSSEGTLTFVKRGQLIEGPLIDVSKQ